jgi:hypothetical protein
MSGSLRSDLFEDLLAWTRKTDLCLALGTSLSGMNADQLVTSVGTRLAEHGWDPQATTPPIFGAVIIAIQRTSCDELASLRIYARLDQVFQMIADSLQLHLTTQNYQLPGFPVELNPEPFVYWVPYDEHGHRTTADHPKLRWDLREDQRLRLTAGQFAGDEGEVVGINSEGHIKIRFFHAIGSGKFKAPMERTLGTWWIQAAVEGTVHYLPIVNI